MQGETTVGLTFTPTATGNLNCAFRLTAEEEQDFTSKVYELAITGVGFPMLELSSAALSFGSVVVGGRGVAYFHVYNPTVGLISPLSVAINGSDAAAFSFQLSSTQSEGLLFARFLVRYTPSGVAAQSANVVIRTGFNGNLQVSLTGTPLATLSPDASLAFYRLNLGAGSPFTDPSGNVWAACADATCPQLVDVVTAETQPGFVSPTHSFPATAFALTSGCAADHRQFGLAADHLSHQHLLGSQRRPGAVLCEWTRRKGVHTLPR
jgi:hypothetical protein